MTAKAITQSSAASPDQSEIRVLAEQHHCVSPTATTKISAFRVISGRSNGKPSFANPSVGDSDVVP